MGVLAGTQILLPDRTSKLVENIRVGDIVLSNLEQPRKVTNTFIVVSDTILYNIVAGTYSLTSSSKELIAVKLTLSGDLLFIAATDLKVDNYIELHVGLPGAVYQKLTSITQLNQNSQTYSLEVETDNSYIANYIGVRSVKDKFK